MIMLKFAYGDHMRLRYQRYLARYMRYYQAWVQPANYQHWAAMGWSGWRSGHR